VKLWWKKEVKKEKSFTITGLGQVILFAPKKGMPIFNGTIVSLTYSTNDPWNGPGARLQIEVIEL